MSHNCINQMLWSMKLSYVHVWVTYIYICVCVINYANKFNEIDAKIGLIFFKAKRKREKVFFIYMYISLTQWNRGLKSYINKNTYFTLTKDYFVEVEWVTEMYNTLYKNKINALLMVKYCTNATENPAEYS